MKNEKLEKLLKKFNENSEEWKRTDAGTQRVVNSYFNSKEYDCFVIRDMWESETEWAVDCLRACEVKEIVFADTSTEATKVLRRMLKKGCKITGVKVYKTIDWGTHKEDYEGIIVEL